MVPRYPGPVREKHTVHRKKDSRSQAITCESMFDLTHNKKTATKATARGPCWWIKQQRSRAEAMHLLCAQWKWQPPPDPSGPCDSRGTAGESSIVQKPENNSGTGENKGPKKLHGPVRKQAGNEAQIMGPIPHTKGVCGSVSLWVEPNRSWVPVATPGGEKSRVGAHLLTVFYHAFKKHSYTLLCF